MIKCTACITFNRADPHVWVALDGLSAYHDARTTLLPDIPQVVPSLADHLAAVVRTELDLLRQDLGLQLTRFSYHLLVEVTVNEVEGLVVVVAFRIQILRYYLQGGCEYKANAIDF